MKNEIVLNFKLLPHKYISDYSQTYEEYLVTRSFLSNMRLIDVIHALYNEYSFVKTNEDNFYIEDINELLWGEYFPPNICNELHYFSIDYEEIAIGDLDRQFNLSNKIFVVLFDRDGIGELLSDEDGVKIFFHTNEKDIHHKPHIHCSYSGYETRIEIETLKVLDKPFKKAKMDKAISFIKENQDRLLEYWNRVVINGEPIKFKHIV